jgi:hypothetical protein
VAFKKKKSISNSRLDRNLGKKLMKCYVMSIPFYGAGEGWKRSSEHISVTNEEILHSLKGEVHIRHTKNQRRANWIGHILCRNCLIKHVMGGKAERT